MARSRAIGKKSVLSASAKKKDSATADDAVSDGIADDLMKKRMVKARFDSLARTLKFRQFLGASIEPRISDSEIIVCFADVRGFTSFCRELQTEMQDRKIQNFLKQYGKVFNEGLMSWYVKNIDLPRAKPEVSLLKVADYVVPSMYKNLGDGMMIVWEIPPHLDPLSQGVLCQCVLAVIFEMQKRFYFHFRELSPVAVDSYGKRVVDLEIGFGVAKGHAWRLDYGHGIDYAGSVIHLASRLQDYARPRGVVSTYDVSTWAFDQLAKNKHSKIREIDDVKGYGKVKVWSTDELPKGD